MGCANREVPSQVKIESISTFLIEAGYVYLIKLVINKDYKANPFWVLFFNSPFNLNEETRICYLIKR